VVFAYVISILEGLKTYKQVGEKKFADGSKTNRNQYLDKGWTNSWIGAETYFLFANT
jgi:hypothetical protein